MRLRAAVVAICFVVLFAPAIGATQYCPWITPNYTLDSPYVSKANVYTGEIHCHSNNSDGATTPAQVVTAYRDAGANFIILTDHDKVTADPGVSGILYITGSEMTSTQGHIGCLGCTNVVPGGAPQGMINNAESQGAVTILNHPNYSGAPWTTGEIASLTGFNAIEIFNFSVESAELHGYAEANVDTFLSGGGKAWVVAGDDSHDSSYPQYLLRGRLIVNSDTLTQDAVLTAIRGGNFYASQGPSITVSASGKTISATTGASSTIEFVGSGGTVLQSTATTTSASYTATGNEVYIRVRITRASDSKKAWSNPIYIVR